MAKRSWPKVCWAGLLGVCLTPVFASAVLAESFPFGQELMLDVRPMKGSKRVPIVEVREDGSAEIDLWCNSLRAQFVVAADTVTVITGELSGRSCSPDRAKGDDEVLTALQQVTHWQRDGSRVMLIGPTSLRFRIPTN